MSRVSAALPRKSLQEHERKFLKVAGTYLAQEKVGGPAALADLLDMVASWHSLRTDIEFGEYCKRWVLEGNSKSPPADKLLRNLLGLDQPPPRRIRRAA
ncbi:MULTISPECIES: hypothetical protein [Pseudomonas]|uniref:Uncharacterized protein n=1 Tax=Pseudomonas lutea TaxID=243924 RepID=A0A9X0ED62_9PSED|nr:MULTISPECIES: hypothetical protein [Pseudomonas]KGF63638.1 hypothetical protein LT42_17200 [Pseudomonas lutea]TDV54619.1 hypothetical protein EC919_104358 [Pseudomonas graminis]